MVNGSDNIDPYVVQQVIPQIATQLAHIFNRSFLTGIVPSKLKIAKVIPIYKNDNPELFANYSFQAYQQYLSTSCITSCIIS